MVGVTIPGSTVLPAFVFSILTICFTNITILNAHLPPTPSSRLADGEPVQKYNQEEEDFIRTPPGFDSPGLFKIASGQDTATLKVKVIDETTGKSVACRVNVIGPEGNFYEPISHSLEPFSARNIGCHIYGESHAPSRYYGWYFYTLGEFAVNVPAGNIRIQIWKGYEYLPVEKTIQMVPASQKSIEIEIRRTAPMEECGYYSGDTHIHLNRRNDQEARQALGLTAAEDIRYGFILCMNDPKFYNGRMDSQEWPQQQGFGLKSVLVRDSYGIISAQEYRSEDYGHICLLMHDQLALQGTTVNPNNWPVFGRVSQMIRQRGGYSFHAHGGYSKEIYADYVQGATDGVELLQMAHYRGIGLAGWYRILNLGYRFPGLAASDFPYVRALGDCRTYVYSAERPDFSTWAKHAAEGRSFFTTGPLLVLEVNEKRPGDIIEIQEGQSKRVSVQIRVRCEVTPVQNLELIVNGNTTERWKILPGNENMGVWHQRKVEIEIGNPSWIAARAYGLSKTGRSDAEAHTNPVYINTPGSKPHQAADVDWLVEKLDGQITHLKQRSFPEKIQALEFFNESRRQLLEHKQ